MISIPAMSMFMLTTLAFAHLALSKTKQEIAYKPVETVSDHLISAMMEILKVEMGVPSLVL